MKEALVIGGSNGIGLAIALQLAQKADRVSIIDRVEPAALTSSNIYFEKVNLLNDEFDFLERYDSIDTLVITAGFGRVAGFETITDKEISNSFQVNTISTIKVLRHFFPKLAGRQEFNCAVMVSIAGRVSSPMFALYGATKAALSSTIESLNIEIEHAGSTNRILEVSPGSIKGTRFNGGANDLDQTASLASEIIQSMMSHKTLLIPQYEEVFSKVISDYHDDPHAYGLHSLEYKLNGGRINNKPQVRVGYLSGTFDLFHVGHLNMIQRALEYCDYLVVGVHPDASHKGKQTFIPFEERKRIVGSIKGVDKVIAAEREDSDVYEKGILKFDFLFVGSDYKGSERFNRYEEYFADKGVKIIYFPYTQGTSSTQLREALSKK